MYLRFAHALKAEALPAIVCAIAARPPDFGMVARSGKRIGARENSGIVNIVDYIVLGGGSSGCALAGRLSQDGERTVLLIEAGRMHADS